MKAINRERLDRLEMPAGLREEVLYLFNMLLIDEATSLDHELKGFVLEVLQENRHMALQTRDLQRRMTELVEENRLMKAQTVDCDECGWKRIFPGPRRGT